MIDFSNAGSRIFTGKIKPEFRFNFVKKDNQKQTEAELKKMGIEIKQGQE